MTLPRLLLMLYYSSSSENTTGDGGALGEWSHRLLQMTAPGFEPQMIWTWVRTMLYAIFSGNSAKNHPTLRGQDTRHPIYMGGLVARIGLIALSMQQDSSSIRKG
eukprot:scaffold111573_cov49-Cyclotella_meneghiniana.AAC.1